MTCLWLICGEIPKLEVVISEVREKSEGVFGDLPNTLAERIRENAVNGGALSY